MIITHKIGDKVIALSTSGKNPNLQPRTKGEIYVVKEIMYCNGCATQFVNIGYQSGQGNLRCGCSKSQSNGRRKWTYSKEFAPITEDFLKQMEAAENYEICSIIKKELDKLEKVK